MKRTKYLVIMVILVLLPTFVYAFFSNMSTSSSQSAAIDQVTCVSCGACWDDDNQAYWVFTQSGINDKATWVNCNGSDGYGLVYF